jgi:predicted metal-dependent hydrolase
MSRSAASRSPTPVVLRSFGSGNDGIVGTGPYSEMSVMPESEFRREIDYRIRRSDRARRIRVNVDADGVEVVLPRRAAEREATAAVRELEPWIRRRLNELAHAQQAVAARGDAVPYLGELLEVRTEPGRERVHRRGAVLWAPAGAERNPALERWYRRAARAEIPPRLERACALAGSSYAKLTIRGQRTRWAS